MDVYVPAHLVLDRCVVCRDNAQEPVIEADRIPTTPPRYPSLATDTSHTSGGQPTQVHTPEPPDHMWIRAWAIIRYRKQAASRRIIRGGQRLAERRPTQRHVPHNPSTT